MAKNFKDNPQDYPLLGRMFSWVDRPGSLNKLIWALAIACLIVALADFAYEKHGHYDVENLPNFYGFYGFISFAFIIFAAKTLRSIIKRPEDYYGDKAIDREAYPENELERKEQGDD